MECIVKACMTGEKTTEIRYAFVTPASEISTELQRQPLASPETQQNFVKLSYQGSARGPDEALTPKQQAKEGQK